MLLLLLLSSVWAGANLDRAIQRAAQRIAQRDSRVAQAEGSIEALEFASFQGGAVLGSAPFECPVDLLRTSGDTEETRDGGRWMCGLGLVGKGGRPCVVYSLGSNFDSSFEEEVQRSVVAGGRKAGCDLHIYDPTLRGRDVTGHADPDSAALHSFRARLKERQVGRLHEVAYSNSDSELTIEMRNLGPRVHPALSLHGMLAANGHSRSCVDVLKVDVEGAEGELLNGTRWSELCVGILVFELHSWLIEDYQRLQQQQQQQQQQRVQGSQHSGGPEGSASGAHNGGGHGGGGRDGGTHQSNNASVASLMHINPSGQPPATHRERSAFHDKQPFTVGSALTLIRRLEAHGFMHYASEAVCGWCPGQLEIGMVNVSWLREMSR